MLNFSNTYQRYSHSTESNAFSASREATTLGEPLATAWDMFVYNRCRLMSVPLPGMKPLWSP